MGCSSLTSLDLSNFDMKKVTGVTDMLGGMTSLTQIKAPYNLQSGVEIDGVVLNTKTISLNSTEVQTVNIKTNKKNAGGYYDLVV